MRKVALGLLGGILILFGLQSPMTLIFPMWIFVHLFRKPLVALGERLPVEAAFVLFGLAFGLLEEIFAILQNRGVAPEERALLNPDPIADLALGVVFYTLLIVTWLLLISRIKYSKRAVFIITGLFGLVTEQMGAIVMGVIANPIGGTVIAAVVVCVYGIFPMLAYMLTEHRFKTGRRVNSLWFSLLALGCIFLQWAVYGLFIHPSLSALLS